MQDLISYLPFAGQSCSGLRTMRRYRGHNGVEVVIEKNMSLAPLGHVPFLQNNSSRAPFAPFALLLNGYAVPQPCNRKELLSVPGLSSLPHWDKCLDTRRPHPYLMPHRNFCIAIKKLAESNHLPDYRLRFNVASTARKINYRLFWPARVPLAAAARGVGTAYWTATAPVGWPRRHDHGV